MSTYTQSNWKIQERTRGMVNALHQRLNPGVPATLEGREYRLLQSLAPT